MNSRPLLASLFFSLLFTGCATFTDAELGLIQRSGVSPRLVNKMESGRELTPEDVIELTRRAVPDRYILRQIEDAGVDYVLSPEDFKKLQQARVSPAVLDALGAASDDFASHYAAPQADMFAVDPYPYPYYEDPYGPRRYSPIRGSIGIGVSTGGPRHWRRH